LSPCHAGVSVAAFRAWGIPTIGIWGEWNTADSGYNRRPDNSNAQIGPNPEDNFYFAMKSHTETATSAEAFALMYDQAASQVVTTSASTTGSENRTRPISVTKGHGSTYSGHRDRLDRAGLLGAIARAREAADVA